MAAKPVCRVYADTAGGMINSPSQTFCFCGTNLISVIGDGVSGHGRPPHSSPTMIQGSSFVFINSIGVVRQGDAASCGHTASPGSQFLFSE